MRYNYFVTVLQEIFYSEIKNRPSAALLYCDKFGMQIGGSLLGAQKMKEIQLTQGQVALVDDDVFEWLNQFYWQAQPSKFTWYAVRIEGRRPKRTKIYMHREIMGNPKGSIDHRNGNGLNNLRSNLRICTPSENMRNRRKSSSNTAGFKGVSLDKQRGLWAAYIGIGNGHKYLGRFDNPEEAARAYDEAAILYYGVFAKLNFPTEAQ